MPRGIGKIKEAKDVLLQTRKQASDYLVVYQEMINVIDWACKCLDNQSMTPEESQKVVKEVVLRCHMDLHTTTSQGIKDILKRANDEKSRLIRLYDAK